MLFKQEKKRKVGLFVQTSEELKLLFTHARKAWWCCGKQSQLLAKKKEKRCGLSGEVVEVPRRRRWSVLSLFNKIKGTCFSVFRVFFFIDLEKFQKTGDRKSLFLRKASSIYTIKNTLHEVGVSL